MRNPHIEWHRTDRIGWLRAAVLGANDGIVSTASLVVGIAAANSTGTRATTSGSMVHTRNQHEACHSLCLGSR